MSPTKPVDPAPHPERNRILAALPDECKARILPQLTLQTLESGTILIEPGEVISSLRFPVDAVVALSIVLGSGVETSVAILGREGMTGVHALFDRARARQRARVVVSGQAYMLPAAELQRWLDREPGLRDLILAFMDRLIDEGQQNVACAAHHTIENRLSRLLLEIRDRMRGERVHLTQEQLAALLGVRREGISQVASSLKAAGGLSYARGNLQIEDRMVLEEAACECYATLRDLSLRN